MTAVDQEAKSVSQEAVVSRYALRLSTIHTTLRTSSPLTLNVWKHPECSLDLGRVMWNVMTVLEAFGGGILVPQNMSCPKMKI